MKGITLPISKSIANRILLLQAINGDELMPVAVGMPDDVIVLHDALEAIRDFSRQPSVFRKQHPLTLQLKNCGTALRFLTVHLEQRYPGEPIRLTGDARLMERKGAPTSQTASALLMHGIEPSAVSGQPSDESPYVAMTRRVIANYPNVPMERDWSAAAFWYEYVALHGGQLLLEGLKEESIQGDRVVADIYARYFGVETKFVPEGAKITHHPSPITNKSISIDFTNCPDLYPVIALTCEKLGIGLAATGTERLRYKESDRLEAVRTHEVRNDHRMAMALMAADYAVSEKEQACIAKSYPQFADELSAFSLQPSSIAHITPIRGVNDDNQGKKHALSKLIHAAEAEYVWMHDDDVAWPSASLQPSVLSLQPFDLIILPLRMESEQEKPSLLERLQIAEYAAIQELTMRTAKKGQAVMCSGANLIVRRDVWLACESELHPDIPSGDDMFLLEAAKRHGYTVSVIDEPDYTAIVRPATTWRAFFRQRMRWAGKAPHYTDRDIRRCGLIITLANIAQLLCPPIILIKFPIEYSLIRKRESSSIINHQSSIKEPRTPWYVALLLEILYPFYLLICLIGGLFRREW